MERIKFSIAIPTYKDKFLKEAIDSVMAQTYSNFELIIVNDASPYNIDAIVQDYNDNRLYYFKNEHNCGAKNVVENWNICLSKCSGEYIICMGDDDRLKPNYLNDIYLLINKYPDVDILHSRTEVIDENSKHVETLSLQPERESFFEFILSFTDTGLGSYIYKTKVLNGINGFYKLPYGWSSDVVSALYVASFHGIAHTINTGFQYRASGYTISHDVTCIEDKLMANNEATSFLLRLVSSFPVLSDDEKGLKEMIPDIILKRMNQKNDDLIEYDIRKNFIKRAFFWLTNIDKYNISLSRYTRCLLKSLKYKVFELKQS